MAGDASSTNDGDARAIHIRIVGESRSRRGAPPVDVEATGDHRLSVTFTRSVPPATACWHPSPCRFCSRDEKMGLSPSTDQPVHGRKRNKAKPNQTKPLYVTREKTLCVIPSVSMAEFFRVRTVVDLVCHWHMRQTRRLTVMWGHGRTQSWSHLPWVPVPRVGKAIMSISPQEYQD